MVLPKISVITATYNSDQTLGSTLDSLKRQTYVNVEHVIVDGASTDNTLDIIRRESIDGVIVESRRDQGIYDALNRGIGLATGDVVGFLHSDDVFPDVYVLERIAGVFEDPEVDVCFGDLAYVRREDASRVVRRWRSGAFRRVQLKLGWMPPHPTVYVRSELLKQYLFNLSFKISGDYDVLLRLLRRDGIKVVYIPSELVHMRLGGVSNKSVANIWKKTKEDWRAIRSNNIGGLLTLVLKNTRKIPQFFVFKR